MDTASGYYRPSFTIGELKQIAGTIWTDDTKTTIEPDLEDGIVHGGCGVVLATLLQEQR